MTPTPCKQAVIALAARLDVCASEPSRTPCQTLREAAQALRHLASQPSLYEAGLRDMRERAAAVANREGQLLLDTGASFRAVISKNFDERLAELHEQAGTVAQSIAAAISALPADGGANDIQSSDGGAEDGSSPIPANREEQRARAHGVMPVGDSADASGCTDVGPSEATPSTSEAVTAAQIALRLMWRKDYGSYLDTEKAEHIAKTVIDAALSAPVEAPVAGQEQYRCAICGFVIDTRYEATKPTIEFGMAGRAKAATARPLPSLEQTARFIRMVQALLRYTNPFNIAEDHSLQWQAVHDECDRLLTLLGGSAHG